MKLDIRIKMVLFIGLTVLVILGILVQFDLSMVDKSLVQAVEWRSQALAQNILDKFYTQNHDRPLDETTLKRMGAELSARCAQVYELNQENQIQHIFVIDSNKIIVAHHDKNLINTEIKNAVLRNALGWRSTVIVSDGAVYHTMTPILGKEKQYLGVIDVGFPKKIVSEEFGRQLFRAIRMGGLFLFVACAAIFLITHFIVTKPLKNLVTIGERLSQGHLLHTFKAAGRGDEIALLGMVFVRISGYLKEILDIAEHVAKGGLEHEIHRRSRRDILGLAMQGMLSYLQNVSVLAANIAKGDLRGEVPLRSDIDAFGRAMREMTAGLQALIQQIQISAGQLANMGKSITSLADQDMVIVQDSQTSVERLVSTMTTMGKSAEDIAMNMEVLSNSVEQTSASTLQMTTSITNIASSASDLEKQTQQTIIALQNATNTLQGVGEQAEMSRRLSEETIQDALEGQQAVEQVTTSMATIQQTNRSAVETITSFAQQTQDIGTILDVINEITDQSGLLALNASIIAAQAGSHGKGFAVIADEMRSLATKVNASTKNIAVIVHTVQQETSTVVQKIHEGTVDIEQGVKRTQEAQKRLEKITDSAQRSSKVVSEIVKALQEMQKTTGHDMKIAMEEVHTMTAAITRSTNEQKTTTLQIGQAVEHINDMVSRTKEATSQQLEGVQNILEVANALRTVADQNLHSSQQIELTASALDIQAQTLLKLVDRFKLRENNHALVERTPAETALVEKVAKP
jgi:methyl-accepting chemotaxis protein